MASWNYVDPIEILLRTDQSIPSEVTGTITRNSDGTYLLLVNTDWLIDSVTYVLQPLLIMAMIMTIILILTLFVKVIRI